MPVFNSKIVEFDSKGRVLKVKALVDTNHQGITLQTMVLPPYRSLCRVQGELVYFQTHSTIEAATEYHERIAKALHAQA